VLSGHPLLTKAALDAVSQWLYRPTTLNGEPVEVIAPIIVTFRLN
jgi:outer membrane biosynthesis protein TonB